MPASSQASSELSTASLTVVSSALRGLSNPSKCRFLAKNSLTEIVRCLAAMDCAVAFRRLRGRPLEELCSLMRAVFFFFLRFVFANAAVLHHRTEVLAPLLSERTHSHFRITDLAPGKTLPIIPIRGLTSHPGLPGTSLQSEQMVKPTNKDLPTRSALTDDSIRWFLRFDRL